MNQQEIETLTTKYNLRPQYFPATDTLFIDTGLDNWKITYHAKRERQYTLYHQNKFGKKNIYHTQGLKSTLEHALDSIYTHKGVLFTVNPCLLKQKIAI
ncbi:MAG TPA: hypothetical protein VIK86_04665 [Candidatus Paceibacterota bacterium]